MKVSTLIKILSTMNQDLEVLINYDGCDRAKVYDVTESSENISLLTDDKAVWPVLPDSAIREIEALAIKQINKIVKSTKIEDGVNSSLIKEFIEKTDLPMKVFNVERACADIYKRLERIEIDQDPRNKEPHANW